MTFATRFAQHLFFILAGLIFCEANGFAIPRAINLISEEGTTLNFGKLRKGDKSTKKIHFKNIGRRRIHLLQGHIGKGIFTFSGGKFPGIGGNCTSVIKPGKSCEVVIAVAATSIGKKAATFNFTHQERNEQSTMLLKLEAEVLPYLPPNIFLMYGYSDADKVSQNQKAPYVSLEEWDDKWGEVIKDFMPQSLLAGRPQADIRNGV